MSGTLVVGRAGEQSYAHPLVLSEWQAETSSEIGQKWSEVSHNDQIDQWIMGQLMIAQVKS